MRIGSTVSVALLAVSTMSAQAPVSQALIDGQTVYIEAPGVERQWLNYAASEFLKQGRFELVQRRDDAELIVTLTSSENDGWLFEHRGFGLVVRDTRNGDLVWEGLLRVHR